MKTATIDDQAAAGWDLAPNVYLRFASADLRLTRWPEAYVDDPDAVLRLRWMGGWERFEPTLEVHTTADGRQLRVMEFLRRTEIAE